MNPTPKTPPSWYRADEDGDERDSWAAVCSVLGWLVVAVVALLLLQQLVVWNP
jgi:hypothetical protein